MKLIGRELYHISPIPKHSRFVKKRESDKMGTEKWGQTP
jgi:hypothetical protein